MAAREKEEGCLKTKTRLRIPAMASAWLSVELRALRGDRELSNTSVSERSQLLCKPQHSPLAPEVDKAVTERNRTKIRLDLEWAGCNVRLLRNCTSFIQIWWGCVFGHLPYSTETLPVSKGLTMLIVFLEEFFKELIIIVE